MSAAPPPYQPTDQSAYPPGPPQGYYPPPQGVPYQQAPHPYPVGPPAGAYAPPPSGPYVQPTNVHLATTAPAVTVVQTGGCPNCHMGNFTDHYGCCAIVLAVLFFPLGILCCLAMRERQCVNCGYTTG